MTHRNTVFRQMLQLIDRHLFNRVEQDGLKNERPYRTLNRWQQFVVMMFAQLAGSSSLRDIVEQFGAQAERLYHLGLKAVKRSTLADANELRAVMFHMADHHQPTYMQLVRHKVAKIFDAEYAFDPERAEIIRRIGRRRFPQGNQAQA